MNKFRLSRQVADSGATELRKERYAKKNAADSCGSEKMDHNILKKNALNKSALSFSEVQSRLDIVQDRAPTRRSSEPMPFERLNASSEITIKGEGLPTVGNMNVIRMWERMVDDYLNANSMTLPDLAKHFLMLEEEESRRPDGFEKRFVVSVDERGPG